MTRPPVIYGPALQVLSGAPAGPAGVPFDETTCVGCGCTDSLACDLDGEPCEWVSLDRIAGTGLCSGCDRAGGAA